MTGVGEIDFLDQSGQGRGLATTGGAADQNQAIGVGDELFQVGMQIELFDGGLKGSQQPDGKADAPRCLQDVDAATDAANGPGQVSRTPFQKTRPVFFAEHLAGDFQETIGRKRLPDGTERAADPQRGRQTRFQVEIAGAVACRQGNQ